MPAKWDEQIHNVFLDLYEDEYRKAGPRFSKKGWTNLENAFNEKTGNAWNKKQLKNHLDQMKKNWALFKTLIEGETGLGWDATKKTIDVDDSWWNTKIAINKDYRKFQGKDLSPYWFRYDALFSNVPSARRRDKGSTEMIAIDVEGSPEHVPNEFDDKQEQCDSNGNKRNEIIPEPSLEKKRKAIIDNDKHVQQKVRGASVTKQICIPNCVDLKKTKSTTTSATSPGGPTIKDCLDIFNGIPHSSLTGPARYFGLLQFAKKDMREIFVGLKDDNDRVGFIKFMYDEEHK